MQELFRSLNITRFSAGVVAQLDSGEIGCNRADVLRITRLKKKLRPNWQECFRISETQNAFTKSTTDVTRSLHPYTEALFWVMLTWLRKAWSMGISIWIHVFELTALRQSWSRFQQRIIYKCRRPKKSGRRVCGYRADHFSPWPHGSFRPSIIKSISLINVFLLRHATFYCDQLDMSCPNIDEFRLQVYKLLANISGCPADVFFNDTTLHFAK